MTAQRLAVSLRAAVDVAAIRMASYDGREYVVAPVIAALGDSVIRPIGSRGPEFVPAEELAIAPAGWNNRPVLTDHPTGGNGSANEPEILERMAIGVMFHTRFEDRRLKTEAWIDRERAERMGGLAESVLRRCLNRQPIEVSVGCMITPENTPGTAPDGSAYEYVWRDIVPDHLAMLPEGAVGACSIEMGCGAPRAAQAKEDATVPKNRVAALTRILSALGMRAAEEPAGSSDVEMRGKLWDALRAVEPGFDGVLEVYPDDMAVVYSVMPEDKYCIIMRGFSIGENGEVELKEDRREVMPTTVYKDMPKKEDMPEEKKPGKKGPAAVAASSSPGKGAAAGSADCGCGGKSARNSEEDPMSKKDNLIGRLIACERSPFEESDREALAQMGEAKLVALAEAMGTPAEEEGEKPKTPPADAGAAQPSEAEGDAEEVRLSRSEYDEIRAAAAAHKARVEREKSALVAEIKSAQSVYTEAELRAMSIDGLEKVARLVQAQSDSADFSGRGLPRAAEGSVPALPDTYGLNAQGKEN